MTLSDFAGAHTWQIAGVAPSLSAAHRFQLRPVGHESRFWGRGLNGGGELREAGIELGRPAQHCLDLVA